MRKTIWLLSVVLLSSAACKKSETDTHKAATEVRKAQEQVNDQSKDMQKHEGDVAKQSKEVADADRRLSEARVQLTSSVKARIAEIDAKLAALDSRTDPISKKLAVNLRTRRDMVFSRANSADTIAMASWDGYQKEIEDNLDSLDKDADKAMSNDKDRDKILDRTYTPGMDRTGAGTTPPGDTTPPPAN